MQKKLISCRNVSTSHVQDDRMSMYLQFALAFLKNWDSPSFFSTNSIKKIHF